MKNFVKAFIADQSGAAAAEYALILAIVGAGIAGAAYFLGTSISNAMNNTANKVTTCTTSPGGGGC